MPTNEPFELDPLRSAVSLHPGGPGGPERPRVASVKVTRGGQIAVGCKDVGTVRIGIENPVEGIGYSVRTLKGRFPDRLPPISPAPLRLLDGEIWLDWEDPVPSRAEVDLVVSVIAVSRDGTESMPSEDVRIFAPRLAPASTAAPKASASRMPLEVIIGGALLTCGVLAGLGYLLARRYRAARKRVG